jgi:iron complex transport system permease protein
MNLSLKRKRILFAVCIIAPIFLFFCSLFIGRYPLSVVQVVEIISSALMGYGKGEIPYTIVIDVRMPRALLALIVGGALAVCGGALQGIFRNPLVDSGMLGVSSGAGFGACLGILVFGSGMYVYILAFFFGLLAVFLSYLTGNIYKSAPTIMLVLGGVIISSIFSALISLLKYIADPYEKLPAITFWLMGSFAQANYKDMTLALIPISVGVAGILLLRWRINLLAIGDKEAQSMGVDTKLSRGILIVCTALATAGAVCMSGTIGWVGLTIPHLCRMVCGNDNRILLPVSLSMGACFMLIVDNIARTLTGGELPIGVLTALIGGPFYIYLLKKTKGAGNW